MADSEHAEQSFTYDAFISYRHVERDRKWAEWLIDALERYRTPKALQERGLPPRLRKIFRDQDEVLASADLNDQIKDALKASRFLIVVCSPYTPRSQWVAREIEVFNELGRGENVLALLTEGEPSDSFPTAILERQREVVEANGTKRIITEDKEPLAADVRPSRRESVDKRKRLALLRLVARILGVKFDELRQREHERERRRRVTWAAVAATLCLCIAGSAVIYWQMMQPKVAYYRQIVWRWGLPEGLGPLDEETRSHRFLNYRMVTQRVGLLQHPRVIEVRRETSAAQLSAGGSLRTDEEGYARWIFRYREDGSAEKIEVFDRFDRLVREEVLRRVSADTMITTFERDTVPLTQASTTNLIIDPLSLGNRNSAANTEITRQQLIFDSDGFVVERRYQDYWGMPRRDAEGSFGERISYLPSGLINRRADLGPDSAEITLNTGVRAAGFTYDKDLNLVRYTLIGADERPFNGPNGFAYYDREFDHWGNDIATTFHAVDGKLALHKDGYAKLTSVYDAGGNEVARAYFDVAGRPTLNKDGYGSFTARHDAHGNVTEVTFLGIDGKPTLHKEGFGSFTARYDARGDRIEEAYFGIDGKPAVRKNGSAVVRQRFDERGNLLEQAWFGVDGKPTLHKDGYASLRQSFDARGNNIEGAYFDEGGKPTLIRGGYAVYRQAFDARGNLIEVTYFGTDGKPTLHKDGFASFRRSYDDRGNIIEWAYFGTDGKPTLRKDGYASLRQNFDARGNNIEGTYLDEGGKPTLIRDGYAGYRQAFDARGNLIAVTYLGTDGKPALHRGGFASFRRSYDDRGNIIEWAYFGTDGKPTLRKDGYASLRQTFDARGNLTEGAYFDEAGKPTLLPGGYAVYRQAFDERGNIIEGTYFGLDGKPKMSANGYAAWRSTFDGRSNQIEGSYFGINGEPVTSGEGVAKVTYAYDTRGNIVKYDYFGIDGKPALHKSGFAGIRRVLDERSNLIEFSVVGLDGKLILSALRTAGWQARYDPRGNLVEEIFFDIDRKPALRSDGWAGLRQAFDARGNVIERTYLDVDHKAMMIPSGRYATVRWAYDARDNVTEESYFGVDGMPAHESGCVKISYAYDELGRETSVKYWDAQDREMRVDIVIANVVAGLAGERSGLMPGDRILTYNGQKVTSIRRFDDLTKEPGAFRRLTVRRGSQILTFTLPSGELGIILVVVRADSENAAPSARAN